MLVGSPSVKAEATTQSPFETDADTVAIGVFEDEGVAHDLPGDELMALLDSGEAQRKFKRLAVTHSQGRRIILAGLGDRTKFDAERARVAAGLVQARAAELSTKTLCWEVPHHVGDDVVAGLVEGTALHAYRFDRYKKPDEDPDPFERLLLSAHHDVSEPVRTAEIVVARAEPRPRSGQHSRQRPAALGPGRLRRRAREQARDRGHDPRRGRDPRARDGSVRRGRPGLRSERPADPPRLRRPGSIRYTAAGPDRQGRDVRLRRTVAEAGGVDVRDEVRHVRGRRGDRGGRGAGRAAGAGASDGDRRRDREPPRPVRRQARRHRPGDGRHHDRDQQHRRRGPARAVGLHHLRAARRLRASRRHRHPHGRGGDRAGPHVRRADEQRRRVGAHGRGLRPRHGRAAVAPAAARRVRADGQGPLRPADQPHPAPRGQLDHRRRAAAPLRRRRAVGAPRHRRDRLGRPAFVHRPRRDRVRGAADGGDRAPARRGLVAGPRTDAVRSVRRPSAAARHRSRLRAPGDRAGRRGARPHAFVPLRDRQAAGRARPDGDPVPGGVRRRRRRLAGVRAGGRGAHPRRLVGGDHAVRAHLARDPADLPVRLRCPEAGVAAQALQRRAPGRVRADRARGRLGRRQHQDPSRARGRRMGDQRRPSSSSPTPAPTSPAWS